MTDGAAAAGGAAAADLGLGGDGSGPEMTPSAAWARRAELMRDPAFRERAARHDPAAREELIRVERSITGAATVQLGPTVVDPAAAVTAFGLKIVAAQEQRVALEREQMIDYARNHANISDEVAQQMRENRPVTRAERRLAEQAWQRCLSDSAWITRLNQGGRAERDEKFHIDLILASPVKD